MPVRDVLSVFILDENALLQSRRDSFPLSDLFRNTNLYDLAENIF